MSDIRVIVGLGNPGKKYAQTRHNVGFMTVDLLAEKLAIQSGQKKYDSLIGETLFEDKKLILLKPQRYMNLSGQAITAVKGFYKIDNADIMVITDDMALEPGVIRIKSKGSAGGHNGLRDIIEKLGTNRFPRLRIGIGKSPYPESKDYVLGKISKDQKDDIENAIKRAADAVFCWVTEGIDSCMNTFNQVQNKDNEKE